ncbi:MAG TPA: UbiA prenyltransferase family protein [Armatimonadota bacterium]|jgi:geranylgeranylglycerol-phosphate geranylgeranyltransferase
MAAETIDTLGQVRATGTAWKFVRAYIKSMRLYYAFVTGITGWVGVSLYHFLLPSQVSYLRSTLILLVLFLSWGVNQIFNDFLGLPEDRINAPHRPMVTGELALRPALWLSSLLLAGLTVASYFFNPWSTIPVLLGVALNILYEYAKAWSLWGNLVFGLSIAMCAVYGYLAAGPLPTPPITPGRVAIFVLVVMLNALMTFFTYFKDYAGDRAAGKRTFIVQYGIDTARRAGIIGACLPAAGFVLCVLCGWLPEVGLRDPLLFALCAGSAVCLQGWTAWLFYRYPRGERAYTNLAMNIRACVAGQCVLIALVNGPLALCLLLASYILIGLLFRCHRDAQA